ncbi:hypothetical protein BIW11_01331 [Tropilaelaps mercedesae]|uniref:Uncharacterized protein n=1 Tax=Tropilaelaps mercedesae TaxID=418985 RepID=A0A1V9XFX7_9ACAR|nr:hypothetical protein BIW11_01331 [Tropilaelaps mercedesae]
MLFWGQMVLYAMGACLALSVAFLLGRALFGILRAPHRGTSVVYVKRPRQELPVQRIRTPATVYEIRDIGNHCVDIDIRTHVVDCELKAYWGVSIKVNISYG